MRTDTLTIEKTEFKNDNFTDEPGIPIQKRETLQSVREILPKSVFENPAWKGLFYFFRETAIFSVISYFLWNAESWYTIIPLWALSGLFICALFVIGHDAAHGALFKNEKLAWWVGQISFIPSLHAYNQWGYGHNRVHHGHTIKINADFVWHPLTPAQYAKLNIFQKAFHRVAWSKYGAGVYYLYEIWLKGMILYSAPIKEARRDQMFINTFMVSMITAVIYYGGLTPEGFDFARGLWMFVKFLFVPFIVWNYAMGFTVYIHHIHKSIPWKQDKEWSPFYGQMNGTINYHINPIINMFLHNIYIHSPHHVHMKIPCYKLPEALNHMKKAFGKHVIERNNILEDYFDSTDKCKLFDRKTGEWMTYKEAGF